MEQEYINIFCIFILPVLIGLVLGIILWNFKKTYIISAVLLFICVILWCVIPNINTHGSEGPGLLLWMFSLFKAAFSFVEIVKFVLRKKRSRLYEL